MVAYWGCGCSLEMWMHVRYVVAHWLCGCSLEMWLLAEDAVAR